MAPSALRASARLPGPSRGSRRGVAEDRPRRHAVAVATAAPSARRAAPGWGKARILAIGHSTRTLEELVELLRSCRVAVLADIRTIPRSRRNPQFAADALAPALERAGLHYAHLPRLGGLRHARRESPNGAWRNASFRGYADHMLGGEFEEGLVELRALVREGPVAVMCAEAVPWRCHRSLLGDALYARGVVMEHIVGRGRVRPHRLTPFAVVQGRRVIYPVEATGAAGQKRAGGDTTSPRGGSGRTAR
jgi:hypothetical protein